MTLIVLHLSDAAARISIVTGRAHFAASGAPAAASISPHQHALEVPAGLEVRGSRAQQDQGSTLKTGLRRQQVFGLVLRGEC